MGLGMESYIWEDSKLSQLQTLRDTFIDLIDAKKQELIWQGEGVGYITQNRTDKEKRINEFVAKILAQFPPQQ
jgi:hypothetical protein